MNINYIKILCLDEDDDDVFEPDRMPQSPLATPTTVAESTVAADINSNTTQNAITNNKRRSASLSSLNNSQPPTGPDPPVAKVIYLRDAFFS